MTFIKGKQWGSNISTTISTESLHFVDSRPSQLAAITTDTINLLSFWSHDISKEFAELLDEVSSRHGCYHFESINEEGESIHEYVGASKTLGKRIPSSYKKRIGGKRIENATIKIYLPETMADTYVLEMYLINKHKPKQNTQSKGTSTLTMYINNLPKPTKRIGCHHNGILQPYFDELT